MSEKLWAYTLGPSTALAGVGLVLHAKYGADAAMVGGGLSLAAAAVAETAKQPIAWGVSAALAYGATITGLGPGAESFFVWLGVSGLAFAGRLFFEHNNRDRDLDKNIKLTRYKTGLVRQQQAELRLAGQLGIEAGPNLTGNTPEETRIREAAYEVYGQELPGVAMEFDEWGWRATLSLPPRLPRTKIIKEWEEKMSNALALEGMTRVKKGKLDNQAIVRFLSSDPLEESLPYVSEDLEKASDSIRLGLTELGDDLILTLIGRHALVLGTSGNGKSSLVQLLILRLVSGGAVVVGIDMKKGVELAPVEDLLETLATDITQAWKVIEWLDDEVERRADIMKERGVRKWTEDLGPYIWVVTDELARLTAKIHNVKGEPTMADMLDERVALDRAFGIHYISATQAPSSAVFGGKTDARTNYKVRISTQLEEAAHAQFAFGPTWKANKWDPNGVLNGPGEVLVSDQEHREPVRAKFLYLTDDDIDSEVIRLLPRKRVLPHSPWGRAGTVKSPAHRIEEFLEGRGQVSRLDIEEALKLDKKQVLNAIAKLGGKVGRDQNRHLYWLLPPGGSEGLDGGTAAADVSE